MYTGFRNSKIRKICETKEAAVRRIGPEQAMVLFERISQIRAAECLADLRFLPQIRLHLLKGNRNRQFALDLAHPKRLIILPVTEEKTIDEKKIFEVEILEIVDYH